MTATRYTVSLSNILLVAPALAAWEVSDSSTGKVVAYFAFPRARFAEMSGEAEGHAVATAREMNATCSDAHGCDYPREDHPAWEAATKACA
jgi:hypothetical protein